MALRSLGAPVMALLMLLPAGAALQAVGPGPVLRIYALGAGDEMPLDCGGEVLLLLQDGLGDGLAGARFAVLTVTAADGPVALNGVTLGTAAPQTALHVVVKASERDDQVLLRCAHRAVASLRILDAPIVEAVALPAHVLGATFVRPGLRAVGMDNFVEVYAATATAGNLTLRVAADGAPLPATLNALGEAAKPAVGASVGTAARLATDPEGKELAMALLRLALVCGPGPAPDPEAWVVGLLRSEPAACGGAELESLLSRYDVPAPAARDLAGRLRDPRCGRAASIDALLHLDLLGMQPARPLPCVPVVQGWFDALAAEEGLPSFVNVTANALVALGLPADTTAMSNAQLLSTRILGGPCGDPVSGGGQGPLGALANRTLATRQAECVEMLVASLRPLRTMWQTRGLITRMGSFEYGVSLVEQSMPGPGELKLTLASQGPVVLDFTLGLAPLPATVGQALDLVETPVNSLLENNGLPPLEEPGEVQPLRSVRLDDRAAADTAEAALPPLTNATSPAVLELLAALPDCSVEAQRPTTATCLLGADAATPPGVPARADLVEVWRIPPAEAIPDRPARALDPRDLDGASDAFLAHPGTPLVPGSRGVPFVGLLAGIAGTYEGDVFVPDRLEVRFGPPGEVPQAALPFQNPLEPQLQDAERFAASRLAGLVDFLAENGARPPPVRGAPVGLVLTGTTFHVRHDNGFVNVTREGPSLRVLDLRDGLARGDLDLDGLQDADEGIVDASLGPSPDLAHAEPSVDPFNPDSDEDGLADGYEWLQSCRTPIGQPPCRVGLFPSRHDAAGDADADLVANLMEEALSLQKAAAEGCAPHLLHACVGDAVNASLRSPCNATAAPALLAWDPGSRSRDSDCDGFLDGWELRFGADAFAPGSPANLEDGDGDALTATAEAAFFDTAVAAYRRQTGASLAQAVAALSGPGPNGSLLSPVAADSDLDGLPDGYEAERGLWRDGDPPFERSDPTDLPRRLRPLEADSHLDPDGDGLPTLDEFRWSLQRLGQLRPEAGATELLGGAATWGLNPFRRDTDLDGLHDGVELAGFEAGEPCYDPISASDDCDGDGVRDIVERYIAGIPQEPVDDAVARAEYPCRLQPGQMAARGVIDWRHADSDRDALPDWYECWWGLDPTDPADATADPDGDGLSPRFELEATLELNPENRSRPTFFLPTSEGAARLLRPAVLGDPDRASDTDLDELPDSYEWALGLDPFTADSNSDTDRDGLTNWQDFAHRDRTGNSSRDRLLRDVGEGLRDDGLLGAVHSYRLSPHDADADGDGLPDGWEAAFGLDPFDAADAGSDADRDGLPASEEYGYSAARFAVDLERDGPRFLLRAPCPALPQDLGIPCTTRPDLADSDGDGIDDGYELRNHDAQGCIATDTYDTGVTRVSGWGHCFDPLDTRDANDDFDGDGLNNTQEFRGWDVTWVVRKVNDDAMGVKRDLATRHVDADPLAWDSSGGGLGDKDKAPHALPGCTALVGLDPRSQDTDEDGVSDHVEVWGWTAVQGLPEDIDGDCAPNGADVDSDGDSHLWGNASILDLSDGAELDLKISEPTRTDTDGDGAPDGREVWQWRTNAHNPLNLSSDFDSDGAMPVRDPDSDEDGIPDGYEFRVGLDPAEFHNATYDTDADRLSDLCEYRITVQGNLTPCPAVQYARPGPGGSGAPAREASGGPSAQELPLPPQGPNFCVGATDPDCDGDGIDDGFENVNQWTATCKENRWDYHAPNAVPDECLEAYIRHIGALSGTIYQAAFVRDINKPHLHTMVLSLVPDFEPGPDADRFEACFYHRACRGTLSPGDMSLRAEVAVEDLDCNLERVEFFNRLRGDGMIALRPLATVLADDNQRGQCREATEAGDVYFYTFSVDLSRAMPSIKLKELKFGGTLHLSVQAWDADKKADASFATNVDFSGRGYRFLDGVNNALERSLAGQTRAIAESVLDGAASYYKKVGDIARSGDASKDVVYAMRLAESGIERYMNNVAWFGSYEYEAHAQSDDPCAPGHTNVWIKASCSALQQSLGGQVKFIAGAGAMKDLTRPVTDGFMFATRSLFDAGVGQKDAASLLAKAFEKAIGRSLGPSEALGFWDYVLPDVLAVDEPETGCISSNHMVNTYRDHLAALPAAPDGSPSLLATERYDRVLRSVPGAWTHSWSIACVRDVAEGAGPGLPPDAINTLAISVEALHITEAFHWHHEYRAALKANPQLAQSGSFRTASGLKATSVGLTLAILAIELFGNDKAHEFLAKACPWLVSLVFALDMAALAAAPATAGASAVVIPLVGFLAGHAACQSMRADAHSGVPHHQGSAKALAHSWSYDVETFPDTEKLRGEAGWNHLRASSDPAHRAVIAIRLSQIRVFDRLVCDDKEVLVKRLTFNVQVDRARGNLWELESTVRYGWSGFFGGFGGLGLADTHSADPNGQWSAQSPDRVQIFLRQPDGRYSVGPIDESVSLTYTGSAVPGLRRVTIQSVAEVEVTALARLLAPYLLVGEKALVPGEFQLFPTTPLRLAGEIAPNYAPLKVVPSVELQPSTNPEGGCGLSYHSEAVLMRGVGADVAVRGKLPSRMAIEDTRGTAPGLLREFAAKDAPHGPGFKYFWDVGGGSSTSTVKTSASDKVRFAYPGEGKDEVRLTVVDSHHAVVAEAALPLTLKRSETKAAIGPTRDGPTLAFTGGLKDDDACVTYEIKVRGETWASPEPCDPGVFGTEELVEVKRDVRGSDLPKGSAAEMRIFRDGALHRTEVFAASAQQRFDLATPVTGWFNGRYAETDVYTYIAPPSGPLLTLAFALRGGCEATFEVTGPVSKALRGPGSIAVAASDAGRADLAGTSWTVLVHSNGAKGEYNLATNLQGEQPAPPAGGLNPGPFEPCTTKPPAQFPNNKDTVVRRDFEGKDQPNVILSSLEGSASWHRSTYKKYTGKWSLHMGHPNKGYPAYDDGREHDIARIIVPLAASFRTSPLYLQFADYAELASSDPAKHRSVKVFCEGLTRNDWRADFVKREVAFLDLGPGDGKWATPRLDFSCADAPVGHDLHLEVEFDQRTTKNPGREATGFCWKNLLFQGCGAKRAIGWFIDDIVVAES